MVWDGQTGYEQRNNLQVNLQKSGPETLEYLEPKAFVGSSMHSSGFSMRCLNCREDSNLIVMKLPGYCKFVIS